MRGQATSQDGGINNHTIVSHDEGTPSTSKSKPLDSNTPPPPPNSVGINMTLFDANLTLNSIQGQAKSEDKNMDIPMVLNNEEVPLTSSFTPKESNIPPPPPSAPLLPPPCPLLPTYYRNYASKQKKWLLKQY
jgi:hypothetical protein